MGLQLSRFVRSTLNVTLILMLLAFQFVPLGAFWNNTAEAIADNCVEDTAGANDEPGQKDLTQKCEDNNPPAGTEIITWNWDDKGTSGGGQSLDACGLFDSDGDKFINFSICVTTKNDPAVIDTVSIYECEADSKIDRCGGPKKITGSYDTECTVTQQSAGLYADPFPNGNFSPLDTVASCTFDLSDLPGNIANLVFTDVCSYPSRQPNSDPSDCVIIQPDPIAQIEVIKVLTPSNDPGKFNLTVNGPGTADDKTVADQGDGGTTGIVVVHPTSNDSNVTVSESAGTNTNLANYSSYISCVYRSSGLPITGGSGVGPSLTFAISDGNDIVCTISNTASSSITIVKNSIPDSTQDFAFTATGQGTSNFILDDESGFSGTQNGTDSVPEQKSFTLAAGTYTFTEAETAGWYLDSIDCPNISETQSVANRTVSLTITAGQNITCTFTNRQYGRIIVDKVTVPANDPTGFGVEIFGPTTGMTSPKQQTVYDNASVIFTVKHGNDYYVNEVEPTGWDMTNNTCSNLDIDGNTPLVDGIPTLTCTITNGKLARLKIVKDALPNHEQNFAFNATGTGVSGFTLDDDGGIDATYDNFVQFNNLSPGGFTFTEGNVSGWALTDITCTGTQNFTENLETKQLSVTLAFGDDVICTFTNDAIEPTLTVVKVVVNNYGGTLEVEDFPLSVTGLGVTEPVVSGVLEVFQPGTYTVSEVGDPGYEASAWNLGDSDCAADGTITMVYGGNYTCTITNRDIAPTLKLVKEVVNQYGEPAAASSWTLSATPAENELGAVTKSGAGGFGPEIVFANLEYTLSENTGAAGYTAGSWSCTGNSNPLSGSKLTLELNEDVVCKIINTAQAPSLTVIKRVVNDDGGTAGVNAFGLKIDNNSLSFDAGTPNGDHAVVYTSNPSIGTDVNYVLSESNIAGYNEGTWSCTGTGSSEGTGLSKTVNLGAGESLTCTIINDDIAPTLRVTKEVINDDGGEVSSSNFQLYVNGSPISFGAGGPTDNGDMSFGNYEGAKAGTAYTVTEDAKDGYNQVGNVVCVDTDTWQTVSHPVTLGLAQNVNCTITNDDIAPKLTLIKHLDIDNDGSASASDWTLSAAPEEGDVISGNGKDGVVDEDAVANVAYTLDETGPDGYEVTVDWNCTGGGIFDSEKNTITLKEGDDVTCEITNGDLPPVVYVEKQTYPNGAEQVFTFNVTNKGSNYSGNIGLSDGGVYDTGEGLKTGSVTVSEQSVEGWFNIFADCFETEVTFGENEEPIFTDTLPGIGLEFTAELGKSYHCRFVNEQAGEVIVTKFHDQNENGYWDEGEAKLEGWEMNLADDCEEECVENIQQKVTDVEGEANFGNVKSGSYELYETMQDRWDYSNTYCEYPDRSYGQPSGDNEYYLYVAPGAKINCFVGNHHAPYFLLTKHNNKPNPVPVGTDVLYTLTVTVPEDSGKIYGVGCDEEIDEFYLFDVIDESAAECEKPVKVIDLPPKNFTYIPGSWTANSNLRGDLKAQGITDDPAYASPGTWVLTNSASQFLSPGEVITLTYLAKIGNVVPGTYPDLGVAVGYSSTGSPILANINASNQTNPFVSSEVTVEEQGEVLAVSTLENTGMDSRLIMLAASLVLVGAVLLAIFSRRNKGLVAALVLTSAVVVAGFGIAPKAEAAAFWTINMSKPAASTDKATINIDWQLATALPDQQPGETFTVTLLQNGSPTGSSQQVTNPNGDSGTFGVTFPTEGTYNLQVQAVSNLDSETKTTSAAAVTYDITPPPAPVIVGKVQNGNNYTVTIKVPEGVQPGTLEIYAAPATSFTADSATLIGTVPYSPGQTVTFSFTKPGSEYFVAARTVDQNGNASAFITESRARVAAAAAVAAAVAANNGAVGDASSTTTDADVLSESDGTSDQDDAQADDGLSTAWWIAIAAAVVATAAGAYYYIRSQRSGN